MARRTDTPISHSRKHVWIVLSIAIGGLLLIGWAIGRRTSKGPDTTTLSTRDAGIEPESNPELSRLAPVPARTPAQSGPLNSPGSESTAVAALPSWKGLRLNELKEALRTVRAVSEQGQDSFYELQLVLGLSIAPILDEQGRSVKPPEGVKVDMRPAPNGHIFQFRDRNYRFQRGEFTAYDRWFDAWTARDANRPKMTEGATSFPPLPPIVVDASWMLEIEQLTERAAPVIERRTKPY